MLLALLAAAAVNQPPTAVPPELAPSVYVTGNYALTFRAPIGSTYCPLPEDWEGSDHGTVLFLVPPAHCYGTGYPSSGRNFDPVSTPRIMIYYGYDTGEDEPPRAHCAKVAAGRMFGAAQPICLLTERGADGVYAFGRYRADNPAELTVTLVTDRARLKQDLVTFKALIATVKACRVTWKSEGKADITFGEGAPCPPDGKWF